MSMTQDHHHHHHPEVIAKSSESQPASKGGSRKKTREPENPFHGVRKRSWGRYVSEIRLPGKKTRVWLGSFGSPEMAARAYDSAAFFLRGSSASLNFPDSVGSLPRPESASRRDIQLAAAKAAVGFDSVGKRTGHEQDGSGAETEIWRGLGELATASFENVKEAPLLSPVRTFDFWSGQEELCSFVDEDEFLLATCF